MREPEEPREARPFDRRAIPAGTVVAGVDGSAGGARALRWALAAAARRGVRLDAVLAWSDPYAAFGPPTEITALSTPHQHQLLGRVEAAVAAVEKSYVGPPVEVWPHVLPGSPGTVLCELSRYSDLLVVGSRGLGGLRRSLLGSVSLQCAQTGSGTLVVVRGKLPHGTEEFGRARRILVGIDGSDASFAALRWAAAEAARAGVQLDVLHAWGSANNRFGLTDDEDQLRSMAQDALARAEAQLQELGCAYSLRLAYGPAARLLVDGSVSSDLLVVSTRGRGGIPALVLGSVSQQCLTHADCPVALVHA